MKPKWQSKLTKKELRHLKEDAGCKTLRAFARTVEIQEEMRRKNPSIEPCWDCKFIARKLGLI